MRYRILLISLLGFILAYTVYWFVLLHHMRYMVGVFIAARHEQGIDITYDKISYAGFPYRFEIDLQNPVVETRAPRKPVKWTSPRLLVESLAWRPGHMVVLTETSRLEADNTPFGHIEMNIKGGKASVVNAGAGVLKRAAAEADEVSLTYSSGPDKKITAGHSEVHFRTEVDYPPQSPAEAALKGPPLYGLAFSLADVQLTGIPKNPYGDRIALLQAQMDLRGKTEPARSAKQMAAWRDRGGILEMSQFALEWGAFDARASGTLALDKEMQPLAAFVVRVKGWEPLPEYLFEAKLIDRELADDIKATLGVIVQTNPAEDEGRVAVPIAVQGGRLFFGPLPLLRVPSISPWLSADETPAITEAPATALPPPVIWPGANHKPGPFAKTAPDKAAPAPARAPAPAPAPARR